MTEIISREPTGRQLADAGIARAQGHAESKVDNWTDRIMTTFELWVLFQDRSFAIEDFRAYIEREIPDLKPPSPQAWGAVGQVVGKSNLVRFIGYRPAKSKATRSHPVRVFVRAV